MSDSDARRLLDRGQLERSDVVANSTMNRERGLTGRNSYARDLSYDFDEFLRLPTTTEPLRWLDLCCGSGAALIEAAAQAREEALRVEIVGVDLVDLFRKHSEQSRLRLIACSLENWDPGTTRFDLITCVHGLHYIGDKLSLLERVRSWLNPDGGRFIGNLDLANIRVSNASSERVLRVALRQSGFVYAARKHLIDFTAPGSAEPLPFEYLGADDQTGPNYTGQPAVTSHYRYLE